MRTSLTGRLLPYHIRLALLRVRVDHHAAHQITQWRRYAVLVLIALASVACCPRTEITRPVVVEVERHIIEPTPADLLRDHSIATGRVSECPRVARERRAALEACNADKAALRAMQGGAQ